MTYFPKQVLTKILAYCDDRVEQRQRELKGKVLDIFYRNSQLSYEISGYVYICNDDDLPVDQLFDENFKDLIEEIAYIDSEFAPMIEQRESYCDKVCKLLNIDSTNKKHIEIINEAETKLGISVFSPETTEYGNRLREAEIDLGISICNIECGYYRILFYIEKHSIYWTS